MTIIAILAVACVGFLALFWLTPLGVPALTKLGGGQISPDLRFGYDPASVYSLLETYGRRGIAHWRRLLLLDMVFPALYAALLALLGAKWTELLHAGPGWEAAAILFPIGAGASDYVENILLLRVLKALPRRIDGAVKSASVFTRAKLLFFGATLGLPLLYWAADALR